MDTAGKVEPGDGGGNRAAARARRPRLLLIGPLPPPYAGPEIGTRTLLESPLRERFRIEHLNTTTRGTNAEKGTLRAALIGAYIRFCAGLVRRLLRRPDYVLYLVTSTTFTGRVRDLTFVALAKLVFRRRVVMQFRGGHFGSAYESASAPMRWALRALIGRIDLMLVQARRLQDQFAELLPPGRIDVLANAVDVDSFARVERTPSDERRILFIGHFSPAKGYCDLLRAAPTILERHPRARFLMVGTAVRSERNIAVNQVTGETVPWEEPSALYEERIAAAGLDDRFTFLGNELDGEDKLRVLRDADVFVLPSYSEGFSMALLEAIAAGTAVVTTPVGAAPEIVQDGRNGFLIMPGDVDALADRVSRLLDDDALRREMAARNERLARERYDVPRQADALEAMLRGLDG